MFRHLEAANNGGEQVVEIVRNTAGQLPYGFHLVRLAQLILRCPPLLDLYLQPPIGSSEQVRLLHQIQIQLKSVREAASGIVSCKCDRGGEHHHHVTVYGPPVQKEAACQRQRGGEHVGNKGRQIVRERDQRGDGHTADNKGDERLLDKVVGKQ